MAGPYRGNKTSFLQIKEFIKNSLLQITLKTSRGGKDKRNQWVSFWRNSCFTRWLKVYSKLSGLKTLLYQKVTITYTDPSLICLRYFFDKNRTTFINLATGTVVIYCTYFPRTARQESGTTIIKERTLYVLQNMCSYKRYSVFEISSLSFPFESGCVLFSVRFLGRLFSLLRRERERSELMLSFIISKFPKQQNVLFMLTDPEFF